MEQFLSSEGKIDIAAAAATSAGTAVDGSAMDMQGYDAIMFITTITTANAGNFLKASQSNDSGGSPDDFSDIKGSKVVADSDADLVVLDIRKPMKRYVKPHVIRAGTNTAVTPIIAIRYNSRKFPQVNDVLNTLNQVQLVSPDEGTA